MRGGHGRPAAPPPLLPKGTTPTRPEPELAPRRPVRPQSTPAPASLRTARLPMPVGKFKTSPKTCPCPQRSAREPPAATARLPRAEGDCPQAARAATTRATARSAAISSRSPCGAGACRKSSRPPGPSTAALWPCGGRTLPSRTPSAAWMGSCGRCKRPCRTIAAGRTDLQWGLGTDWVKSRLFLSRRIRTWLTGITRMATYSAVRYRGKN